MVRLHPSWKNLTCVLTFWHSERHWPDPTISNIHLRIHCILYEKDPVANIPPFVYATDFSTNGTYLKKCNEACASSQTDRGILMGKTNSFLLEDGDELRISNSLTLVYHEINPANEVRLTLTQEREKQAFNSRYLITGRLLGIGAYGKVLVAIRQKSQHQLACKVVNLKGLYKGKQPPDLRKSLRDQTQQSMTMGIRKRMPSQVARCFREFEVLQDLVHPNIISIEKVFWSPDTIFIFEELITGGDLFTYIEYKGGRLEDVEAAVIVRQILKGTEYLHDRGIVHRDLKPDNILMTSLEDGARVVITDFGNARHLPESQGPIHCQLSSRARMFSLVGTLEFAAPEIHKANQMIPRDQGYSKSVDMWSIGSITTALLSGDVLFTDRGNSNYHANPKEVIIGLASRCDISIIDDEDHPIWRSVGHKPKDFIKNLLILQEADRMSVKEALDHPWFSNECHAAEFEALYERSIRDWVPRQPLSNLVEAIPSICPIADTEQEKSHHFPPVFQKSAESQSSRGLPVYRRRAQSSSPPQDIEEDEEAQFEDPSNADQHNHEEQSDPEHVQESLRFRTDEVSKNSMDQLSLDDPPASGMYSGYDDAHDSYGYDNSIREAMKDVANEEGESIQVEFPPGYTRRRASEVGLESSIVCETQVDENGGLTYPPDSVPTNIRKASSKVAPKRLYSRDSAIPSYSEIFDEQEDFENIHVESRTKRMRFTPEYD
jgi:pheromone a factor receptor